MNPTMPRQDNPLRRYLLGESTAEERTSVEQRLMRDQPYLDEMARAEDDLIDEYARGELEPAEKEKFESLFLNIPERREKIAFSQALHRAARPQAAAPPERTRSSSGPGIFTALLAAAVVLLAFTSGFFYWRLAQTRGQLADSEEQRAALKKSDHTISEQLSEQQRQNQQLQQAIAALQETTPDATSDLVTLKLSSGWSRGAGGMPEVRLPKSAKRLRLNLTIGKNEPSYSSYRAQVQTIEGRPVWTNNNLADRHSPESRWIVLTLPTPALNAGDYLVTIIGIPLDGNPTEVATYYFRVAKK